MSIMRKMWQKFACSTALALMLAGPAFSDVNLKKITKDADAGVTEAQITLGEMYMQGKGVKRDGRKAYEYLEKASQNLSPRAFFAMGLMFRDGLPGIKRDYAKAKEFFEQAVEFNHNEARVALGEMYLKGQGMERNFVKAAEQFHAAAMANNKDGMYFLATMLFFGDGVKQDLQKARYWASMASDLGSEDAQKFFTKISRADEGKIESQDVSPEELKELESKAADGDSEAIFSLAVMYHYGYSVPKNLDKAMELYRQAAEKGNASAYSNLGVMYFIGEGVDKDLAMAAKMFKPAAEGGVAIAQMNLGLMYLEGKGVERNAKEALKLLTPLAAEGEPEACFALAQLYLDGDDGVPADQEKGVELLRTAAENGKSEAKALLKDLHL